jgi:hypothetical protein
MVQLPDDYVVSFRYITKIQMIDTTRSHRTEIKDSFIILSELRLLNE